MAVNASVTMSEVLPRSSPEAAARLRMPSMPSSMSPVFQPAMAMYSKPCAASVALNLVSEPISLAFARSASKSSPVAPEMAPTLLISSSKSAVVLTATPRPAAAAAENGASFLPASSIAVPASLKPLLILSMLGFMALVVSACCFSSSFSWPSHLSIWLASSSYSFCPISPLASICLACSWACFNLSSFSLVLPIWSPSNFCFSLRRFVFDGSSFRSLLTSLRLLCVARISLSTFLSALDSGAVSPPICTVIPLILSAITFSL